MKTMRRCAQLESIEGQYRYKRVFRVMDLPLGASRPAGWWGVSDAVSPATHYWDSEVQAPVLYPQSPGEGWVFDFTRLDWVPDADALWMQVRRRRDALLAACDWRVLPDSPMPQEERAAWQAYRQALRDVTEQADPLAIVWPDPPG